MTENCGNCWCSTARADGALICRRHPNLTDNNLAMRHPVVKAGDWCADHIDIESGPPPTGGNGTVGITDGSEAPAGAIGEYHVVSNATGLTLPTNTPKTVCSLALTPGDWEIWGTIDFRPAAGVSPNAIAAAVSTHTDALPTDTDLMTGVGVLNMFATSALTTGQRQVLMTGTCRSNAATPLTVYLVGQTTLGGSGLLTGKGYICARRMR